MSASNAQLAEKISQLDEKTSEKDAQLVKAQYESSAQLNAEISANLQAIEYFKGVLDTKAGKISSIRMK